MPSPLLLRYVRPGIGRAVSDVLRLLAAIRAAAGDQDYVLGAYDYRYNVGATGGLVDTWADVRAQGGGPTLAAAGTARPTLSATGLQFNGTTNFLRNATQGRLAELTDNAAVVLVGVKPSVAAVAKVAAVLSQGTTRFLNLEFSSTSQSSVYAGGAAPLATVAAPPAGLRIWHGARGRSAGNLYVSNQYGAAAATVAGPSAAAAVAAGAVNRLTLGTHQNDVPSATFADLTDVRALLILSTYTVAMSDPINAWARDVHGVTL